MWVVPPRGSLKVTDGPKPADVGGTTGTQPAAAELVG